MNHDLLLKIYRDNQKKSKRLCKTLEDNIKLKRIYASKEALNAYDETSRTINIIRQQLEVVWNHQIELIDLITIKKNQNATTNKRTGKQS